MNFLTSPGLEVLQAGMQTTVQDGGRQGLQHRGIGTCGALDGIALQLANRLVGNAADAAALEILLGNCTLHFHRDAYIALTGAECLARLDERPLRSGWRTPVRAGQRLRLFRPTQGLCTYLAFAGGGLDVPQVLGSHSTDLNAHMGGFQGRALRPGDRLSLPEITLHSFPSRPQGLRTPLAVTPLPATDTPLQLRALPGSEYADFTAQSQRALWQCRWRVSPSSNRMGYRLLTDGARLQRRATRQEELLSHGVVPGTIQVPPSGSPIVLLADAQTTGGYPKIAVVIQADLWKCGQAQPGGLLQFARCSFEEALAALREQRLQMQRLEAIVALPAARAAIPPPLHSSPAD